MVELFEECELLGGFKIKNDYLSRDKNSMSVRDISVEKVIKNYCDGGKICQRDFVITLRLEGGEDNLSNSIFLEELCEWIAGLGEDSPFPDYDSDTSPISIEITNGPLITSDEAHTLLYEMECVFQYIKSF